MNILFLHQNFPAQFIHVARALAAAGHNCVALVPETNRRPRIVSTETYRFVQEIDRSIDPVQHYAERIDRGSAAADGMLRLKDGGFTPDVVIGHGGWGETLFVKDVWPATRVLLHAEFYYTPQNADVGFDPEFTGLQTVTSAMKLRARNAAMLQALVEADLGVAPTHWQASRFPVELGGKITVLHEGIDTAMARPNPAATVRLDRSKLQLSYGDEVVTFVSRNLEPYRGFHSFMRSLPAILAARPKARVVIVGGNDVSYGPKPPGRSWRHQLVEEVRGKVDMDRVHIVGQVPHSVFIQLMQVSAVHVYLTYPFVLSWSMLEAMACAATVVGSRTAPVQEVIEDRQNGRLVDFFDRREIADVTIEMLSRRHENTEMRFAARHTVVSRYDLRTLCLPGWMKLAQLCPVGGTRVVCGGVVGASEC